MPAPGMNGPGGASLSPINLGGGLDAPRTTSASIIPQIGTGPQSASTQAHSLDTATAERHGAHDHSHRAADLRPRPKSTSGSRRCATSCARRYRKSQALKPFKDQLLIDIMPEGLRVQIVDAQNRPMFDVGSAAAQELYDHHPARAGAIPGVGPQSHQHYRSHGRNTVSGHARLYQLGTVGRPGERRAAHSGRIGLPRGQDRTRHRPRPFGALGSQAATEPGESPHQHHRDDSRGGRRTRRPRSRLTSGATESTGPTAQTVQSAAAPG